VQLAHLDSLPPIEHDQLQDGDVDLWCFFYEEALRQRALFERYEALMTREERNRRDRFHFERDKHLYVATRALVRTVLSEYEPTAPADWRFHHNSHGKPFVAGSSFHFNLANTRGLVVCAVSRQEVGVDAEDTSRNTETITIADSFFSPAEVRALKRLPPEHHRERFFSYWTLKESYIKARGLGLAIPLADFSFELDEGDGICISFEPGLDDDPARWQFRLLLASPVHYLAVGLPHPKLNLRAKQFIPLTSAT
jgi:4'-phosphopantetheinyl transferase